MDKFIDILVETDKGKVAVEIAITPDHEKVNIEKDISCGVARVFVACRDNTVLENVTKILDGFNDDIKAKVKLCLVQQLVSEMQSYIQEGKGNGLS